MSKIIPVCWINYFLLVLSILFVILCIVMQQWLCQSSLPIYVPISWAIIITVLSTWFSCFVLKLAVKANAPLNIKPIFNWICRNLMWDSIFTCSSSLFKEHCLFNNSNVKLTIQKDVENQNKNKDINIDKEQCKPVIESDTLNKIIDEIESLFINVWYKNISNDVTFPEEAKELLKIFLKKLKDEIIIMNKIQLFNRMADVFLLHLKEYRRALRRVEKGTVSNVEKAYKRCNATSCAPVALEHSISRLVMILAREFLQWEVTSSLPCKLLLAILAKKLLLTVEAFSSPVWILQHLLVILHSSSSDNGSNVKSPKNTVVTTALSDGMTSATAAVIPRPLSKFDSANMTNSPNVVMQEPKIEKPFVPLEKSSLLLNGLSNTSLPNTNSTTGHRTFWLDTNSSEVDSELDEDRISPIYEEPTDFASTIARLRCLLQQKSTATTPLPVEEKSCVLYDGSQFLNLTIPRTEFYTAADGSQHLLYCIQFDDVEQRSMDTFETTTATVRRQYSDFIQLHNSLEEIPSLSTIMSEIILPEGGRIEMEAYLKTLCTRLANDMPTQLRHFLRPSSNAGKKADIVTPSFDRILAKIVSGTFNTLKTVVPGFEMEPDDDTIPMPTLMPLSDIPWRFVPDAQSKNLSEELQQLIAERIDYCTVDTAYEAVDSIEGNSDSEMFAHWWYTINSSYDDEIDELDASLSLTCTFLDLICEILSGVGSSSTLQQEAVIRWIKFLFGNLTESLLQNMIILSVDCCTSVTLMSETLESTPEESFDTLKDRLVQSLVQKIPPVVQLTVGKEDVNNIFNFLIESLRWKRINQDLTLQLFEVFASQLLLTCRKHHCSQVM